MKPHHAPGTRTPRESDPVGLVLIAHHLLPNGPAERFVALAARHHLPARYYALPMPKQADRPFVRAISRRLLTSVFLVRRHTSDSRQQWTGAQYPRVLLSLLRDLRAASRTERQRIVIVAFDPLAFLLALVSCGLAGIRPQCTVLYLVDISLHRLTKTMAGFSYRALCKFGSSRANELWVVSEQARNGVTRLVPPGYLDPTTTHVVPVPPLAFHQEIAGPLPPAAVAYVGTLTSATGADLLPGVVAIVQHLTNQPIPFHIVASGASLDTTIRRLGKLPNVYFHDLTFSVGALENVLHQCSVGLAMYDPERHMYDYGDSMKIKDYLAAGLRPISTLPVRAAYASFVRQVPYSVEGIAEGIMRALGEVGRPAAGAALCADEDAATCALQRVVSRFGEIL